MLMPEARRGAHVFAHIFATGSTYAFLSTANFRHRRRRTEVEWRRYSRAVEGRTLLVPTLARVTLKELFLHPSPLPLSCRSLGAISSLHFERRGKDCPGHRRPQSFPPLLRKRCCVQRTDNLGSEHVTPAVCAGGNGGGGGGAEKAIGVSGK